MPILHEYIGTHPYWRTWWFPTCGVQAWENWSLSCLTYLLAILSTVSSGAEFICQEFASNHPLKYALNDYYKHLMLWRTNCFHDKAHICCWNKKKKEVFVNAPAHVAKADVAQRSSKPTVHVGTPRVLFPTQNVSLGQKSLKHLRIARIRIHQQHKKLETLNPKKLLYICYVS